MVSIKDRKILRQMFSHYDYVMTTAQLSKEKLYYRDIQRMLGAGLIEKVKRGYYHWTMGSGKGDVVIISRLFPDGILCILGAAPFALMGFVKYNGMNAEQFVWAWMKSEFLMPKKLMFHPDNLYYETLKATIQNHEKEALKNNA